MPAVLTILRVDADARLAPHARALTGQLDGVAGDPEIVADPARGSVTVVVAFHLAADAVDAALRLIAALPPAGRPRMALATGRADIEAGVHRGPA
ncbi:MAG TPA: hypothetical protein VJM49_00275, partial [Acidimicrobiales bacterium]|nr:hypothetical protein [Acidimicrobiales bacterium]